MVLYYAVNLLDNTLTRKSLSSGICIGNYKVRPLVFVDDIVEPNGIHMLKQSHANALQFASKIRLEFSTTKCKVPALNHKYPIENIHNEATPTEEIN